MVLRLPLRLIDSIKPPGRPFSTSTLFCWRSHANALERRHANVPPYPHGSASWYKQSDKGLYGGQSIRFGNNVGEKSKKRTRRAWHPNLVTRNIKSSLLGRFVRIKLTTRVVRTIDKVGGIDAYLLGNKAARVKELGLEGWKLRCEILQSPAYRALAARERHELLHSGSKMGESEVAEEQSVEESGESEHSEGASKT